MTLNQKQNLGQVKSRIQKQLTRMMAATVKPPAKADIMVMRPEIDKSDLEVAFAIGGSADAVAH